MKSDKKSLSIGYDVVGNIAILKFGDDVSERGKKVIAMKFLEDNKNVRTVLEKTGKFSGRLRTLKTKHLAGEKTKESLYKENDCLFRFNVETCYFSGRLSEERKEIANLVRKGETVLVMFGGVAPFAIVIAKKGRAKEVVSVELGRECSRYAEINVKRNKLEGKVKIVQGDVRRVLGKENCLKKCGTDKFDRIVMARPNLKDSFLDVAFPLIKKGGLIHYYGFYEVGKVEELKDLVRQEAKKARKKVRILRVNRAGDIGPYKFRFRVDMKIG